MVTDRESYQLCLFFSPILMVFTGCMFVYISVHTNTYFCIYAVSAYILMDIDSPQSGPNWSEVAPNSDVHSCPIPCFP